MLRQTTKYSIFGIVAAVAAVAFIGYLLTLMPSQLPILPEPPIINEIPIPSGNGLFQFTQELKKFASDDDLKRFLLLAEQERMLDYNLRSKLSMDRPQFFGAQPLPTPMPAATPPLAQESEENLAAPAISYSTTNIQVQGVDEPDFLKNDGKYVYILSNDKLTIVEAYPPQNATVIAKVGLDVQGQVLQNMFLNDNRLIIFYQGQDEKYSIEEYSYIPSPVYSPTTHALVLDISDKENPKTVKNYEVSGYYNNARLIGEHVYFIVNNNVEYRHPIIPYVAESDMRIMSPEVFYFDNPEDYYTFNTVAALDLQGEQINAQTYMMGPAGTIYVSDDSIYITYQQNLPYIYYQTPNKQKFFDVVVPLLPVDVQEKIRTIENSSLDPREKWQQVSDLLQETYNRMPAKEKDRLFNEIQNALQEYETRLIQDTQKTVIHKIGINRLALNYTAKAEVPGRLLNQFSMDEFNGKFRIATTSEFWTSQGSFLHNNVYVLDETLNRVGSLEKIAPKEQIYSARFMGDRLYLVTFERTDPFFVIDLSQNTPKILGELKMPGFSNYLHPYDENHIIGIGRETKENQWGGVQTEGLKIALFDVSNVSNPRAVDVVEIGDQSTHSEVLNDHKAFLLDKEKSFLSLPVESSVMIEPLIVDDLPDGKIVEPKFWKGFYVYGITPGAGFNLKGKVAHYDGMPGEWYGYGYGSRSFYIGNVLYTATPNLLKMNDLGSMNSLGEVKLGNTGEVIRYLE